MDLTVYEQVLVVVQGCHGSNCLRTNVGCCTGVSRTWTGRAGSLFIASWCVLTFMLTSFYTSKLTSLMVGVTPSPPFTTVKEMLARDDYRWGMVGGTKLVQILRVGIRQKGSNNAIGSLFICLLWFCCCCCCCLFACLLVVFLWYFGIALFL